MSEPQRNHLKESLQEMARLKNERDRLKQELKQANEEYRHAQNMALTAMEVSDLQNVKFDAHEEGTFTAFQHSDIRARVTDPEAFSKWCNNVSVNDNVDDFKMFSAQKITACVRELLQDETASLPDGVEINDFSEVRLRKE